MTYRPSAETDIEPTPWPPDWAPSVRTLTRVVTPLARSRANTSYSPLVSPGTRFDESDPKTTVLPSPESTPML